MKHAYIVTGLGFGDEGKGTITHWLAHRHAAHTVVRTGGPQALHRVVCADGRTHVFSQFGSGALRGSATHLSRHMLIDPYAILKEGEALENESGVRGVFASLTIHEDALVITPFHAIAGRLRELVRGKERRGSVGIGVGETIRDAELFPGEAVHVRDLTARELRDKLSAIRMRKWREFEHLADRLSDATPEIRRELEELESPDTIQWAIEQFGELVRRVRVVDTSFVTDRILGIDGTVVFEGSQGVLLDRYHGFHPYTTQVRTTPASARAILRECGYVGGVTSLGVLRAYHTRHGGGPFVAGSPELTKSLPDATNQEHRWQGSFRVGAFDELLTRYALDVCRENGGIDGLVITCIDRLAAMGRWPQCFAYRTPDIRPVEGLVSRNGGMVTRILSSSQQGARQIERQSRIAMALASCSPSVYSNMVNGGDSDTLVRRITASLAKRFDTPVVAVSTGETEEDKCFL